MHIAETDAQARAELEEILTGYQDAVDRENAFNARAGGDAANRKTDHTPHALSDDYIEIWCLYGSPATVPEKLRHYAELGIGNVLCGTTRWMRCFIFPDWPQTTGDLARLAEDSDGFEGRLAIPLMGLPLDYKLE